MAFTRVMIATKSDNGPDSRTVHPIWIKNNQISFIFSIFLILVGIGCESRSGLVRRIPKIRAISIKNPFPIRAKKGEFLNLNGSGFILGTIIQIGETKYDVEYVDANTVRFKVPEDLNGKINADLLHGDQVLMSFNFYVVEDGTATIFNADSKKICSDITYFNPEGSLEKGTRNCSKNGSANSELAEVNEGTTPPIPGSAAAQKPGSAAATAIPYCQKDGELGCVTTNAFRAVEVYHLASKVVHGYKVAGVDGTAKVGYGNPSTDTPSQIKECSEDNQIGCLTTSRYRSFDFNDIKPQNIRSGVVIAGIKGEYPSKKHPLLGASTVIDLKEDSFVTRLISAQGFEYWSSDGTRHLSHGDTNLAATNIKDGVTIFGVNGVLEIPNPSPQDPPEKPDPWNIRAGATINGIIGKLKVNCRNAINSQIYNSDEAPTNEATTTGTLNDWWDTIDDFNNSNQNLPSQLPDSWNRSYHLCDETNWEDLSNDGACDNKDDDCIFQDKMSGLIFSESTGNLMNWSSAVAFCLDLNHAGYNDWRLPTVKELQASHINGIRALGYKGGTEGIEENNKFFIPNINWPPFWSATTATDTNSSVSEAQQTSWIVSLSSGWTESKEKNGVEYQVLCVRP